MATSAETHQVDESAANSLEVSVRSLGGNTLRLLNTALSASVGDVKAQVQSRTGIPVRDQRLVLGFGVVDDTRQLVQLLGDASRHIEFMLVRGPAFNFDRSLAHPRAFLDPARAELRHGGQTEYQAAFLSDVLDPDGTYSVPFRLHDANLHGKGYWAEMYIGLAPDENRNWSYLKGAYMSRQGLYVDAFGEPGWWKLQLYHERLARARVFAAKPPRCDADETQVVDFSASGPPVEHSDLALYKAAPVEQVCGFTLEVDMTRGRLQFLTAEGEAFGELRPAGLRDGPVRLCATVGYPGQRVVIADVA